jgi:RimJ/RimL family protein N-acetyltransferase
MTFALLQSIKQGACGDSALCIPVGRPPAVLLRAVSTTPGRLNAGDVAALTEWRNRHVSAFLTGFTATEARTARWLADSVGPDGTRILFMVDRIADRVTIGYMGLAFIDWQNHYVEADAIVRGLPAARGVMRDALLTLLAWARDQLGLTAIGVRVRSDNPAHAFYQSLGFRDIRRTSLRRCQDPWNGHIAWVEDPSVPIAEPALVHMRLASAIGTTSNTKFTATA